MIRPCITFKHRHVLRAWAILKKCFSVTVSAIYCFMFCAKLGIDVHFLMKTRTATHSWFVPHTTDSRFFVFPPDIWCKINKSLKYYKYQLTKRCLEGRLEGFKVSSWYFKLMKLVEDRIAKKCHDFHHCCRWLHHHYSRGCHVWFYFNETVLTLTT